jgi:hypothetical protein
MRLARGVGTARGVVVWARVDSCRGEGRGELRWWVWQGRADAWAPGRQCRVRACECVHVSGCRHASGACTACSCCCGGVSAKVATRHWKISRNPTCARYLLTHAAAGNRQDAGRQVARSTVCARRRRVQAAGMRVVQWVQCREAAGWAGVAALVLRHPRKVSRSSAQAWRKANALGRALRM